MELPDDTETIVACATPRGRGAIAIVRLSGSGAGDMLAALAPGAIGYRKRPRRLFRADLQDETGRLLDRALVVYFPSPASFTGEDVVEFHCHGGEAVVAGVIQALCRLGARPARPGEFSRRAFLKGKLSLCQAEAIARMIEAGSQQELAGACRALRGELEQRAGELTELLRATLARLEAGLDFPDESEVSGAALPDLEPIARCCSNLEACLRRQPEQGIRIAVAGRTNVGKSSIINALSAKETVLVTEVAGTTRDVVPVEILLDGRPVQLLDTAGLEEAEPEGRVEREAARVSRQAIADANLVLWVTDRPEWAKTLPTGPRDLPVINKADLIPSTQRDEVRKKWAGKGMLLISVHTGEGLPGLIQRLGERLLEIQGPVDGIPVGCRQAEAIGQACHGIEAAQARVASGEWELAAWDLRLALEGLGQLRGERLDPEVLERIFETFCIGK